MLEVYNTCIKLSPFDVEFIMGLRAKGLKIDMNKDVSNKNDLCKKNIVIKRVIAISDVKKSN